MNISNKLIKKIIIIIFAILSFFSHNIINVNAVGWGSDIGGSAAGSAGGGPGGKTSSGFALGGPVLLQVCIVNVSRSHAYKDSNQCIYFKSSSNWKDYHDLTKVHKKYFWTKNMISPGGFADVSYNFNIGGESSHRIEKDSDYGKSAGWWHTTGNWGLLYSATTVRDNFISGGNASNFFQQIARKLLKQGLGWDETKVNGINFVTLEGLTEDDITDLANYRIIVEPIYSFKKNESYYFATLKGIAKAALGNSAYGFATMSNPKDPYLGVSISGLYNNNYSEGTHGVINSSPLGITNRESYYKKLADVNDGRGYGIFFIIPCAEGECPIEITPSCEQQDNKLFCIDGDECGIDKFLLGTGGVASCDCKDITDVTKLTTSEQEFYNTECDLPTITIEELDTSEYYSSTLRECDMSGTSPEEYTIAHHYTRKIEPETNKYCTIECEENINISNLTNPFTTLAGKYFEIPKPSIVGDKECGVKVYNKKWKNDYNSYINILVSRINAYQKEEGKSSGVYDWKDAKCPGDEKGEKSGTRYYYNYIRYSYNKSTGEYTNSERSSSYRDCGSYEIYDDETWDDAIDAYDNVIQHLNEYNMCLNYLDNMTDFYEFNGELKFFYGQIYSNNLGTTTWNNNKPNGEVDDSSLILSGSYSEKSSLEHLEDGTTFSVNYDDNSFTEDTATDVYKVLYPDGDVDEKTVGSNLKNNTNDYINIYRGESYSGNYDLSVNKYVEALTGKITTVESSTSKLLGKVYDTDVSAQKSDDYDNDNYYYFSTLGDDEEISKVFKSSNGESIYLNGIAQNPSSNNDAWLKRTCKYQITNNVICDSANLAMCVNYRMVDANEIDPNGRFLNADGTIKTHTDTNGFGNWRDVKGVAVYKEMKETDTFNPSNLEYSFTLDSATIKKIRDYNATTDVDYDTITGKSLLECDANGNECESQFLTELEDGDYGLNVNAKLNGRNLWKYLIYNSSTGWSIAKGNKDADEYIALYNSTTKYKDEGVTP